MKFLAILLFIALAFADTCFPGYYGADCMSYCDGSLESGVCTACTTGSYAIKGVCYSQAESACETVFPYLSQTTACEGDYSGKNQKTCVYKNNAFALETVEDQCYSKQAGPEGIPVGSSGVDMVLTFTGLLPGDFTSTARVNMIYAFVSAFPFAVGDIQIGYTEALSVNSEGRPVGTPKTDIHVRIITLPSYSSQYELAEGTDSSSEGVAANILTYLKSNAPSVFHVAVSLTVKSVDVIEGDKACASLPSLDGYTVYYDPNGGEGPYTLNTIVYLECGEGYSGHAYTKCAAVDGDAVWTPINTKECVASSGLDYSTEEYVEVTIKLTNVDSKFINSNTTLEFYPLFIEVATTKLNDLIIYDVMPDKEDALNTIFTVRFSLPANQNHHVNTDVSVANQLLLDFHADTMPATLKTKLSALDPIKFPETMEVVLVSIKKLGDSSSQGDKVDVVIIPGSNESL
ncbi:hypothetical protein WA158_005744 [Blastocystis sp. Blastoise]